MPLFHSWVAVLCPSESFSCSLVHEKRGDAPSSQRFWEKISVPSRNPSAKHGINSSPVPPISEFWFVVRSSSHRAAHSTTGSGETLHQFFLGQITGLHLVREQEKARVSALYQQTIGMLAHSAAKAEAEEVRWFWRVDGCGNSW